MNEKFFSLPEEKQQTIINAGYRVFSQNSYKKSPMSEIAAKAGISKSLLFHYFHNKQELYLFLWEHCAKITIRYLTEWGCYEETDLWEMMQNGPIDVEKMERDLTGMIEFWKKIYLRREKKERG